MSKRFSAIPRLALAGLVLAAWPAKGDDVKIQPAPGDGLVVTSSAGTQERLRVQEAGGVYLPGVPALPSPFSSRALCADNATGLVGTCGPHPVSIVCASATAQWFCNSASPCATDQVVNATCPLGYYRLSLVSCVKPLSSGLAAEVFVDPYSPDKLGCRYRGVIDAFTTENLRVGILCIEQTCVP